MIEMSRMFQVSVWRVTPCDVFEPDERGAGDAQHRLEVLADVRAILRVHRVAVAEAERREPPRDVVIAGTTIVSAPDCSALRMNSRARWNSPARARCDTSPEIATTSYFRS